MDNNPQLAKPISDDQELAKVLAGVNQTSDEALQFETTPVINTPAGATVANDTTTPQPVATTVPEPTTYQPSDRPIVGYNPPESTEPSTDTPVAASDDLSTIKKDALNDLRPLVDKLDTDPQEKFDTYLLLIRSTDDKALVAPAYAAAQAIVDEGHKAQALLDVIKEIDYLSNPEK